MTGWKTLPSHTVLGLSLGIRLRIPLLFFSWSVSFWSYHLLDVWDGALVINLHCRYRHSVTCWLPCNTRWALKNGPVLPRGSLLLPSQLILFLPFPLEQLNPNIGNRLERVRYNWDEAGERREGILCEEQKCFKNILKKSVIMEMLLYFSLKFQFPIPDPSVCSTIYRHPLPNELGRGWGQGGRITFCSRWNKSPNLLLFKLP